ncbi:hypothetical protein [Nonomuraea typhae]|uniref:Uncharacterized protein n=1 Tax=Nonomuraea typhae TaxID=2603600 RepID=A0ABW7YXV4_9ACTN
MSAETSGLLASIAPTAAPATLRHPVRAQRPLPAATSPRAADTWTWLILAAHTQLRLARGLVHDLRRPWEKPVEAAKLTPRVSDAAGPGSCSDFLTEA